MRNFPFIRDGSRAAATSKMELLAVNYYDNALHLGCCSSPRFASAHISVKHYNVPTSFV